MFRDFTKYEIFDDGRIWSHYKNGFLRPQLRSDGYLQVNLSDNDNNVKKYQVHRVVYEAVSGQPIPEGMQVNHIDENPLNNHISNLNLMTCKENINWGTRNERVRKTLSKKVEQYNKDGNLIQVWPSINEVQRQLGINTGSISSCCNGRCKTYKGFIWRYVIENPS